MKKLFTLLKIAVFSSMIFLIFFAGICGSNGDKINKESAVKGAKKLLKSLDKL